MANSVTPVEPVDLTQFKAYAKTSNAEDAGVLELFLLTAREMAEAYTGRDFVSRIKTKTYQIDESVEIPVTDIVSVTGAVTDVSKINSAYDWWVEYCKGISVNRQYPIATNAKPTFTVTYNVTVNPADVPAAVKMAIYKIAADLSEHRESSSEIANNSLQIKFQVLLAPYKIY